MNLMNVHEINPLKYILTQLFYFILLQSYKNKSKLFSPSISCSDDTGQQQGNLVASGPPILGKCKISFFKVRIEEKL